MKKILMKIWAAPWVAISLTLYAVICLLTAIAFLDPKVARKVWKEMP